jgi:hypothetical protein
VRARVFTKLKRDLRLLSTSSGVGVTDIIKFNLNQQTFRLLNHLASHRYSRTLRRLLSLRFCDFDSGGICRHAGHLKGEHPTRPITLPLRRLWTITPADLFPIMTSFRPRSSVSTRKLPTCRKKTSETFCFTRKKTISIDGQAGFPDLTTVHTKVDNLN